MMCFRTTSCVVHSRGDGFRADVGFGTSKLSTPFLEVDHQSIDPATPLFTSYAKPVSGLKFAFISLVAPSPLGVETSNIDLRRCDVQMAINTLLNDGVPASEIKGDLVLLQVILNVFPCCPLVASLLLVAMPGAPSSYYLLLVVRPGASSSVLAPTIYKSLAWEDVLVVSSTSSKSKVRSCWRR